MRLYTRSGDDGSTGLFGAGRVGKDHPRVEAYGTVDELNAALGAVIAACARQPFDQLVAKIADELQSRLFDLGADLATPHGSKHESKIVRIDSGDVRDVEKWIDEVEAGNRPISQFILPAGTELAVRLHVARTICRRAERDAIRLNRAEGIDREVISYLNRLSDLLFAMARRANKESGVDDKPWIPKETR